MGWKAVLAVGWIWLVAGICPSLFAPALPPSPLAPASAPASPVAPPAVTGTSPLGTNLFKITTPEMLWFIDQMKRADGWLTQCEADCGYLWDTGEQDQLVLDDQGWVISFGDNPDRRFTHVAAALYGRAGHLIPAGEWLVLYDGEGRIEYDYPPLVEIVARRPGQDILRIVPHAEGLLRIRISEINPENHIRNVRVYPPGGLCGDDPFAYAARPSDCADGHYRAFVDLPPEFRFHPLFLQELTLYRTLRFMQVQGTVEVLTPEPWAARSRLDAAIYPGGWRGIPPLELIFQLSNLVQAEPWVSMPVWADDEYIREFARLARAQLDPRLAIYVEYANEVWNLAEPYNAYGSQIEAWAYARWPHATDESGAPLNGYARRMNYYGMRSAQICALWKTEWAEDASRVRCALGGAPWNEPTAIALACPLYVAEQQEASLSAPACGEQMDALAIAPYFGGYISDLPNAEGGHFEQLLSWTQEPDGGLDQLFHELRTGELLQAQYHRAGALAAAAQITQNALPLARQYGLALIAYEGGQHLAPHSPMGTSCMPWERLPECEPYRAIQELFIAANRDPRMGELYARYLHEWRAAGGTLLVHFHALGQPTYRYGAWGAREFVGQPPHAAPKYSALRAFTHTNPCWWDNCAAAQEPAAASP